MRSMVRFPGLDNQQIAVEKHHVMFLVSTTVNSHPVTNIHFDNGHFVSVAVTLDETLAVLECTDEWFDKKEIQDIRKVAEWKRQAKLDVEAAIKESELFGGKYKKQSHRIEALADGSKSIHILMEPKNDEPAGETQPAKSEESKAEQTPTEEKAKE